MLVIVFLDILIETMTIIFCEQTCYYCKLQDLCQNHGIQLANEYTPSSDQRLMYNEFIHQLEKINDNNQNTDNDLDDDDDDDDVFNSLLYSIFLFASI